MRKYETINFVGLWRSWERASMAWKRSSVRSRPGPPIKHPKIKRFCQSVPEAPPIFPRAAIAESRSSKSRLIRIRIEGHQDHSDCVHVTYTAHVGGRGAMRSCL